MLNQILADCQLSACQKESLNMVDFLVVVVITIVVSM
jgi:hypothetical protein